MYNGMYVYLLMGVFCDRLKLGSTVALDCLTGQNKEKELLLLLVLLSEIELVHSGGCSNKIPHKLV
jgi:hypothetical protein